MAVIKDKVEIERFLRHLKLWPLEDGIHSIRGPPHLLDWSDQEAEVDEHDWDAVDELLADEDWAA